MSRRTTTPARRCFHRLSYLLLLAFARVARTATDEAAVLLGRAVGAAWFLVDRRRRRLALRNLDAALGHETTPGRRRALAFRSFLHLGRVAVELLREHRLRPGNLDRYVVFEGEENLQSARERGRGVIGISAHLGNWELLSAHCLRHGPASIVAKKIRNPYIDRLVRARRLRSGLGQLDPEGSGRALLRELRSGGCVAFLLDQSAPGRMGEPVPFFGAPASTYTGPAALALRTGAAVILLLSVRRPDGRVAVHYGPPLALVRTGDFRADVLANTRRFTRELETWIRRHPDQWLWVHDRWKKRRSNA